MRRWTMMGFAGLLLAGCVVEGSGPAVAVGPPVVVATVEPYYYSPVYCAGCWYGQWGGRIGYHRGGGRPWEHGHVESDHHGENRGRDVRHEGHR
jgi:hypothetical protein